MFSVRRGVRGPTPAGRSRAGTRTSSAWGRTTTAGSHRFPTARARMVRAGRRGARCSTSGSRSDLRSAFAVHAPVPELCRDGAADAAGVPLGSESRTRCDHRMRAVQGAPYARSVPDESTRPLPATRDPDRRSASSSASRSCSRSVGHPLGHHLGADRASSWRWLSTPPSSSSSIAA